MLKLNLLFLLVVLLFSCSPKYTEYNSNGFGGGFVKSKLSTLSGEKIGKMAVENLQFDSIDRCALTANKSVLIGMSQFEAGIHHSDQEFKMILPRALETQSGKYSLKRSFTPKSRLNLPFFQKILNRQKQPRKTILIVVGIGILLGLLGSLVGLFNLLIGRTDIGGIIIGLSLAFSVLFSLFLALYDLDVVLEKLKLRGIKTANDFFKMIGIYLLRLIISLCILILIFFIALAPLFIR